LGGAYEFNLNLLAGIPGVDFGLTPIDVVAVAPGTPKTRTYFIYIIS